MPIELKSPKSGAADDLKTQAANVGKKALPSGQERRKCNRFKLRYPVSLSLPFSEPMAELQTFSRNVSVCGLLLDSPLPLACHSVVSFRMTVSGGTVAHPVQLTGQGSVVRVEPNRTAGFSIAVECTRFITQAGEQAFSET